jgi:hypothetical protein
LTTVIRASGKNVPQTASFNVEKLKNPMNIDDFPIAPGEQIKSFYAKTKRLVERMKCRSYQLTLLASSMTLN